MFMLLCSFIHFIQILFNTFIFANGIVHWSIDYMLWIDARAWELIIGAFVTNRRHFRIITRKMNFGFFSCHYTYFNLSHALLAQFFIIPFLWLLSWRETCFLSQNGLSITLRSHFLEHCSHWAVSFGQTRLLVCIFTLYASNEIKIKTTETDTAQLIGMPRCRAQNLTFHSIDANMYIISTNFDFVLLRFASSTCHYFERHHQHRHRPRRRCHCHHHVSLSLCLAFYLMNYFN